MIKLRHLKNVVIVDSRTNRVALTLYNLSVVSAPSFLVLRDQCARSLSVEGRVLLNPVRSERGECRRRGKVRGRTVLQHDTITHELTQAKPVIFVSVVRSLLPDCLPSEFIP